MNAIIETRKHAKERCHIWPKIYLSVDNCFASKRWPDPEEWLGRAKELGVHYVEASADNECDPLYTTPEYLEDWAEKVVAASKRTGVTVSQFFSGHGTYATLGLCHPDERIRSQLLNGWFLPMCKLAGKMNANFGFFAHGLSVKTLHSNTLYNASMQSLGESLAQICTWGYAYGCASVSVEQMYTPHQPPWTLSGAKQLIRNVNDVAAAPFYLTIDVGHQVGQEKFRAPKQLPMDGVANHTYSFDPQDGDTYAWLAQLGCYSPIIHLQQNDGRSSAHLGFTPENNRIGTIDGKRVLEAIQSAYRQSKEPGMPPKAQNIYLTLEIFSSTLDTPEEIMDRLAQSVRYWRKYVPKDGLYLNELLEMVQCKT